MSAVISVEHLSKAYRLGMIGGGTLRADVSRWWAKLRGLQDPLLRIGEEHHQRKEGEVFWALRDIDFQVPEGEVLGVIGRNGAGKSTLLKILSRVTGPTEGQIKIRGRVVSLLEVGTGFHPELTGRENVFLNGAILGMTKAEIRSKFDEIVAFSEIDEFIDTPVKRYSSGMYVRLAFAVAAHLEPEIMIVDEVLAVGDVQFQKKCLGKMKDVASGGRTVLFVSHNMAAVRTLCTSALLLRGGQVTDRGEVSKVIAQHLDSGSETPNAREWRGDDIAGNEHIRMQYIRVQPPSGEDVTTIDTGAIIEVGFFNARAAINLDCTLYVTTSDAVVLFETGKILSSNQDSVRGCYRVTCRLPPHLLNSGRYYIHLQFGKDQHYPLLRLDDVVAFDIENTTTGRGRNMSQSPGPIRPLLDWTSEVVSEEPTGGSAELRS